MDSSYCPGYRHAVVAVSVHFLHSDSTKYHLSNLSVFRSIRDASCCSYDNSLKHKLRALRYCLSSRWLPQSHIHKLLLEFTTTGVCSSAVVSSSCCLKYPLFSLRELLYNMVFLLLFRQCLVLCHKYIIFLFLCVFYRYCFVPLNPSEYLLCPLY